MSMGTPDMHYKGDSGLVKQEKEKRDDQDALDSLGEALAGVNMSSSSNSNSAGKPPKTSGMGLGGVNSSPFNIAQSDNGTWGNFSDAGTFPANTTNGSSSAAHANIGNEGLELFLSQSPSRSLGDHVFKLSHPNLPSLMGKEDEHATSSKPIAAGDGGAASAFRYSSHALAPGPMSSGSFGDIRPAPTSQENVRRRTESPSCSVTGTTTSSRSVSPYTNGSEVGNNASARTIQAYARYDVQSSTPNNHHEIVTRNPSSFAEDDHSSPSYLSHGHNSHPNIASLDTGTQSTYMSSAQRSPFAKDVRTPSGNGAGFRGSPYDQTSSFVSDNIVSPSHLQHQQMQTQAQPASAGAQQPQVMYMAVPSPDGRGQVLQPIQMIQLPGKPYHFVATPDGTTPQQHQQSSQMNMVLPPLDYGASPQEARTPIDTRSRVASYATENTSRQYSLDTASPVSSRDEMSRSNSTGQFADLTLASLYASPQRPPLDALLGQVRRLSRDQVGCRLVQQALDEEGPMAATLILNEGLPFWGEAMVDPFGNYLFQKVLEKVTLEERIMLVKNVSPRLVNASLNLHGTRSVQKIVEVCAQDEQQLMGCNDSNLPKESAADVLTNTLAPAAARLCIDSHGNHVIQRILLKLSSRHSKFVFDAVAASVGDVARHRHGCCVIQRCLDSPTSDARAHLVLRIVEKSLELMQDAYGNYVVQYVLDVCSDDDVQAVCESVVGKVNLLAIQKFSSNVMEKCLERCGERVKEAYLHEMSDPERIRELMMDPFGNYVVQRALSVATHAQAIRLVETMRPHLIATQTSGPHGQRNGGVRNTAGGRRIIAKICRRFPNFTLTSTSQDEIYSSNKATHAHRHQHMSPHQHHHINQLHHHQLAAPPVMSAYNPIGAAAMSTHHHNPYMGDLRISAAQVPIQQQAQAPFYNTGTPPFYDDPFYSGRGGYSGM